LEKLLLATGNKGKLREITALLQGLEVKILKPGDINLSLQVDEVGQTYAENAARKALTFARASGLLTLADDSGLEVEALNGAPGIYSARFAPQKGATDADRRKYLLQQLQGQPRPWRAEFHCSVALATPDEEVSITEGICRGMIIPQERGSGGFGYDPIFLLNGMHKTMAELSMAEKNQVSHRANAIKVAIPILKSLL
jgi:XTP/dITP diphosphohydrolase